MATRDFVADCTIDRFKLEEEVLEFPSMAAWYNNQHELAIDDAMLKEQRMDRVRAEIGLETREDASKKPTQDYIDSMVILDPRFRKAQEEYNAAKHKAGLLKQAVFSMNNKKAMLELFTKLHLNGVHAEVRIPQEAKSEMVETSALGKVRARRRAPGD